VADIASNDHMVLNIVKMLTTCSKEERRRIIQLIATFFEVTI